MSHRSIVPWTQTPFLPPWSRWPIANCAVSHCFWRRDTRHAEFVGQTGQVCGLVVEQRIHRQVIGERYGPATFHFPMPEIETRVEPSENGRGFTLRAMAAGKPRQKVKLKNILSPTALAVATEKLLR
jgi:hypothetical protein